MSSTSDIPTNAIRLLSNNGFIDATPPMSPLQSNTKSQKTSDNASSSDLPLLLDARHKRQLAIHLPVQDGDDQDMDVDDSSCLIEDRRPSPPLTPVKPKYASTTIQQEDPQISSSGRCRHRKTTVPQRSASRKGDLVPGIVFSFQIGSSETVADETERSSSVNVLKRPVDFVRAQARRNRRNAANCIDQGLHRQCPDPISGFPVCKPFYHEFAEHPDGNDVGSVRYHARTAFDQNLSQDDGSDSGFKTVNRQQGNFDERSSECSIDGSDYDDEDSDVMFGFARKKAKTKVAVKRPRSNKAARAHQEKKCISCQATNTPIWREVKDNWGRGHAEVWLCNACGLQWRMSQMRCEDCMYVPRASEKKFKECARCPGKWVHSPCPI